MATTIVKFHILLFSVMAHAVMPTFKGQLKHWNSVPASTLHLLLNWMVLEAPWSSFLLFQSSDICLLVFTKLFRNNTCRILIVWDANVLLANIVPKHENTYLKGDYLKPINLLIFFFLLWHSIFSLDSVVKCYTVIWTELHRTRICLEASLCRRTCIFVCEQM